MRTNRTLVAEWLGVAVERLSTLYQVHSPDVVTLAELSDVPLVIYRRYQALLSERFRQAGASLVVACLNDDSRTTCNWARRGFGVGLVPLQMCETVNMEGARSLLKSTLTEMQDGGEI